MTLSEIEERIYMDFGCILCDDEVESLKQDIDKGYVLWLSETEGKHGKIKNANQNGIECHWSSLHQCYVWEGLTDETF